MEIQSPKRSALRWPFALLVALSLGIAQDAWPAEVVRGPYLQIGTPQGVVVRWRTDVATDSRVQLGQDTFDSALITTEHEVAVTDLAPSTRYDYTVGTSSSVLAGDSTYTFVTAPPSGTAKPTRFWVLGDCGTGNLGARQVRDAYYAYPGAADTDLWLMLGDNAYLSGTDLDYQNGIFDTYPTFLRAHVLWTARGNHDFLYDAPDFDYYDIFTMPTAAEAGGVVSGTEAYYSFDYANIHFICLDTMGSDRSPTGEMHTWMEQDLAATTSDWLIAFWHHPPYSKGTHDSDSLTDSGLRLIEMREHFLPALEAAGVDLVMAGHSHDYERSYLIDGHYGFSNEFGPQYLVNGGDGDPAGDGAYTKATLGPAAHQGTVYVTTGNAGSTSAAPLNHPVMVTSLSILGSMVIDVDGDRLDAIHLDSTGAVVDRFAIVKGVGVVDAAQAVAPGTLRLDAAPSPFREDVRLAHVLPRAGIVRLAVYDPAGRRVASLRDGPATAGVQVDRWDGRAADGRLVAAGVYFAVLSFEGEQRVRRVIKVH